MPRVKLDYIVSFSSEDPDNPASNLLNWEVSKKRWLCSKGEPSCSVVLQLAKAVKISEIHIGAHNVAFVEVLAGRSEKPNESFQVIVASSIFLSPSESRGAGDGSSGLERVRSFPWSQLQPGAAAQRWDRVRVLCSQPYNKHCKYGLSFVQIYEPEGADSSSHRPTLVLPTITGDDDDEDDDFKPGELFAAHNTSITTDTGSQIRHATSQALKNISNSATKLVKTPITKNKRSEHANEECSTDRRRSSLMYTDDDERPHAKIDHIVQRHKDEKCKQEPSSSKKAKQSDTKKNASSKNVTTEDSDKRKEKPSDSETGKDERLVGNGSDKHTSKNIKKEYTRTGKSQDEETDSSRKLKHVKKTDNGRDSRFDKGSPTPSHEEKRKYTNNDQPSTSRVNESFNTKKRSREKPAKELGSVLAGVELTMSGYLNPERGELRELALRMGAKVHRDWGPSCNLLICAFADTPKLRTARSERGNNLRAVRGEWLREAARICMQPPWRKYAADPKDNDHSSDSPVRRASCDESSDTDDEIERVLRAQKKPRLQYAPSPSPPPGDDDDDDKTDHDDQDSSRLESIEAAKSLPAMFSELSFVIRARQPLNTLCDRYIRAYGGLVKQEEHLDGSSTVDYVLSEDLNTVVPKSWRSAVVSPEWLWSCHKHQALLPP